MFDWLKQKLSSGPPPEPNDPDAAIAQLRLVTSDAQFEDVWNVLDGCMYEAAADPLMRALANGELGQYPAYAATLWLLQGVPLADVVRAHYEPALEWALGLHENTVVLGVALSGLDALTPQEREAVAIKAFERAGVEKPRRFWLLLKVRTDAIMERVSSALAEFREPATGDPEDEDFVYTPTAANWMAGAFRQFQPEDYELAERYFDLENPGARFLVEALGSTASPRATRSLELAANDERPAVRAAALRHLRALAGR